MRISELFAGIADLAKIHGHQAPVIVTDIFSASYIVESLETDLGMPPGHLRAPGCLGMFDGVAVTHPGWPLPENWMGKSSSKEWREYFGDLAEIYE